MGSQVTDNGFYLHIFLKYQLLTSRAQFKTKKMSLETVRNHFSFENENCQKYWTAQEFKLIGQISEAICKLIPVLWWPGKFWCILDLFKAWKSVPVSNENNSEHQQENQPCGLDKSENICLQNGNKSNQMCA